MRKKPLMLLPFLLLGAKQISDVATTNYHLAAETALVVVAAETTEATEATETTETTEASETSELSERELIENEIRQWWETYLLPVFSGVSIATILTALISIGVAVANRKNNKISKKGINETIKLVDGAIGGIALLIDELTTTNKISAETRKTFIETTTALNLKVAELTNKTEELMKLKEIVATLAEIQTQIAMANKEFVKSGIANEVSKLNEQIKSW